MNKVFLPLVFLVTVCGAKAQVGIGTVSPNSMLDVRGSIAPIFRAFTGATSLTTNDFTAAFTGSSATVVTLPDATACTGRIYCIKNYSSTLPTPVLTLSTVSSQKIDGASSATLTNANQAVTVISDGSNWEIFNQSGAAAATTGWALGGNSVSSMTSLGTTGAYDLPIITNNTEKMRISSAGSVGIGASSFSANPEALLVYQNNSSSFNAICGKGNLNNYLQLNIQNQNSGNNASSDLVATADNGSETSNYVDLGMNSSTYSTSTIMGGADNAYLYSSANDFIIGNSSSGKNLILFTGGSAASNERMRITSAGNVGVNNASPAANLDVNGTVKIGTTGTVLNNITRYTNQSVTDNTTFTYNQSRTETLMLTGVTANASVIVNPRGALPTGLGISYAYASATNTVLIGLINASGNSLALGTMAFDVTVIQ